MYVCIVCRKNTHARSTTVLTFDNLIVINTVIQFIPNPWHTHMPVFVCEKLFHELSNKWILNWITLTQQMLLCYCCHCCKLYTNVTIEWITIIIESAPLGLRRLSRISTLKIIYSDTDSDNHSHSCINWLNQFSLASMEIDCCCSDYFLQNEISFQKLFLAFCIECAHVPFIVASIGTFHFN